MNNVFTISSAYEWPKEINEKHNSEKAIKKIVASVKKRFDNKNHNKTGIEFNVVYKRLRASAGRPLTDSIIKRIETANIVIIDITNNNKNVFIELGIALLYSKNNPKFLYI